VERRKKRKAKDAGVDARLKDKKLCLKFEHVVDEYGVCTRCNHKTKDYWIGGGRQKLQKDLDAFYLED
jgi:hypothetical protein